MYKILFPRKEGKSQTDWFPVSMLTSTTRNAQILRKKKAKGKANNIESAQGQAQKQQREQISDKTVDFEISSEMVDSVDQAIMKNVQKTCKNIPKLKCYPKRNRTNVQPNNNYFSEKDTDPAIKQSIRDTNDTNDKFNKISNEMKKRMLEMHNVKADGNCFFRAISRQIFGDEELHLQVRLKAIQKILSTPEDYVQFLDEEDVDLNQFISKNINNYEWADNLIIKATIDAYNINMRLIRPNQSDTVITPRCESKEVRKEAILGCINEYHNVSSEPIDQIATTQPDDLYDVTFNIENFDDGDKSLNNVSEQELMTMDEIIVNVSTATICTLL